MSTLLSQTAEYALRAVVWLASQPGAALTVHSIAEGTKVPPGYLSKVLQTLGRAGLVRSQRGLGGGFVLARPADQITALEVVDAVDPFVRIRSCPLGLPQHRERLCPLHQKLDDGIAQFEQSFREVTIASLLAGDDGLVPLGVPARPADDGGAEPS